MIAAPEPTPVVFLSLFRTDNPYSSISLSMARELAKTRRVLYVNHPYSIKDLVVGLIKGDPSLLRRLPDILLRRNRYETLWRAFQTTSWPCNRPLPCL